MTPELTAAQRTALEEIQANGAAPATPAAPPSTWAPVDLTDALAGRAGGDAPTLLLRDDGLALLYPGKLHLLAGEPEAGKGWLALHASAERLHAGETVLYLDFEDDATSIVGRLQALGVPAQAILERFRYLRPDEPLDGRGGALLDAELARPATLAVVDGVTEALTIHGLSLEDNAEVAKWLSLLPRRLARSGAAVLLIDHVVKDREARGRYAIGAQHKLAGVDVAYSIKVLEPFGRGRAGRSRLTINKDRPGHLRQHADHSGHLAHLELTSGDHGAVRIVLAPAGAADDTPARSFRPTVLMERISRAIEEAPGLTARSLRQAVAGKNDAKDLAVELLVAEHYVRIETDGQARRHHPARPYRQANEPDRAPVPQPCPDRAPGTAESNRAPVPLPLGGALGTGHTPHTPEPDDRAPQPQTAEAHT